MSMAATSFDDSQRFILEGFAGGLPFSSFLPGIAGPLGTPMWVFYVNRGQAIASFGIGNKDNPIMPTAYTVTAVTQIVNCQVNNLSLLPVGGK